MRGDFTRLSFDAAKQFSRVLMQQGRVQLDADWNEQSSLMLDQVRTLARSVIGPYGGVGGAFQIGAGEGGKLLKIGAGTYFVNGILCATDGLLPFTPPESWKSPHDTTIRPVAGDYLVYLAVVERHITFVNDDDIREKALGSGLDTTSRTKVVAIVSATPVDGLTGMTGDARDKAIRAALAPLGPRPDRPTMRAQVESHPRPHDICSVPALSQYRGAGNQLYRVEIHEPSTGGKGATFKWSRDNGSVTFPVTRVEGNRVWIERFGRDGRAMLQKNDWVEIEDDDLVAPGVFFDLLRVESTDDVSVTLDAMPAPTFGSDPTKHPLLRRWDHAALPGGATYYRRGQIAIQDEKRPYPIEQGIQVEFHAEGHEYVRGDYWLVPARTLIGGIDWPAGTFLPARRAESGVAPLASMTIADGKLKNAPIDLRSLIQPTAKPVT
jgi:hypothetical protein